MKLFGLPADTGDGYSKPGMGSGRPGVMKNNEKAGVMKNNEKHTDCLLTCSNVPH